MVELKPWQELPAYPHEVVEAEDEGVRFQWLAAPVRFFGERRLAAVELRLMRLREPDTSGRRRPEPLEGSEFTIAADTAVMAIGQQRRPEMAEWLREIDLNTGGTTNPKVFTGGDAVNGGASVVEAVRDGKRAANAIDGWLRCAS